MENENEDGWQRLHDLLRQAFAQLGEQFQNVTRAYTSHIRRRSAILNARRQHRIDCYRDPYYDPYPPSGCRWCGVAEREHGLRPDPRAGVHEYEHPGDGKILMRMRERSELRRRRTAAVENTEPEWVMVA